jgi:acyl-CoA dehydrogenase
LRNFADDERLSAEAYGETKKRLQAAVSDLADATEWLLAAQAAGRISSALAGASPYQRLFGLVLSGCYLAKGALVEDIAAEKRVALCRFAAENLLAETAALKDRVINGAASLDAGRVALF